MITRRNLIKTTAACSILALTPNIVQATELPVTIVNDILWSGHTTTFGGFFLTNHNAANLSDWILIPEHIDFYSPIIQPNSEFEFIYDQYGMEIVAKSYHYKKLVSRISRYVFQQSKRKCIFDGEVYQLYGKSIIYNPQFELGHNGVEDKIQDIDKTESISLLFRI